MKKSRITENQRDFLEDNSITESRIDAAIEFLTEIGYVVAKDVEEAKNMINIQNVSLVIY